MAETTAVKDDEVLTKDRLEDVIAREKSTLFEPIQKEIDDEQVTDIEWDGTNLWITDLRKGCYLSDMKLTDGFVDNMSIRLSNIMKENFSRSQPVLEANTDKLRISIWHEDRCGKKSITIRKIPNYCRLSHDGLVAQDYAPESLINLLENAIMAHMSCVMGGQPHAGKTEFLKYLTFFIPFNEKSGVYEDNQEIHYKALNPKKKGVEFYIDEKVGFAAAIKAGLRHNIDWLLLSESRGPEIIDMLNALSTGAHCMTTVHLEDVRMLSDRFYNMAGPGAPSPEQFRNTVHTYINICVLVQCDKNQKRKIRQVAFFSREGKAKKNVCTLLYDDYAYTNTPLTSSIVELFRKGHIDNPFGRYKYVNEYTDHMTIEPYGDKEYPDYKYASPEQVALYPDILQHVDLEPELLDEEESTVDVQFQMMQMMQAMMQQNGGAMLQNNSQPSVSQASPVPVVTKPAVDVKSVATVQSEPVVQSPVKEQVVIQKAPVKSSLMPKSGFKPRLK